MPRLLVVLLLVGLLASPTTAAPAGAPPKPELWARCERHDPRSTVRVDHGAWARFLQLYLRRGADGISRVDYGAVAAADRQELAGHVATLAAVPVSRLNRDEQMA